MSHPETDTEHGLPIEDDWFAAPEDEKSAPYEESPADRWDEPAEPEPEPDRGPSDNRPILIGGGIVAVIILIVVGVVLARALSDSNGDGGATTATTPTIPTTTNPVTTATPPPAATTTEPATPPPATPPPAAAALPQDVTLRPGDTGPEVTALQEALTSLGYEPGAADGDYGPATQQAVIAFQQAAGITADGVAGPETLGALDEALAKG